ncbi:chorismate mutase [Vaginisenegalia massiliensis]|uniref:chorismate mutase n=1 Tax=Vaginisenegalia massiliensis TaxID=2058294 RepID=UPI000F528F61|nr:chorismate mutase [Vaginisenegalia massiliensis]
MIEDIRRDIEQIDQQLVRLFEQRMELAQALGQYKQEQNLDVLDMGLEEQMTDQVVALLNNPEFEAPLRELYRELMRLSRQQQLDLMNQLEQES